MQKSLPATRAQGVMTLLVQTLSRQKVGEEMTQKIVRSTIQAWLLSVILIFGAQCDVADAQGHSKRTRAAVACGKLIKKQCSGVPVQANSIFECIQKNQDKLPPRCAALAINVVRTCDRDASTLCQGVVAGSQGNIVDCLTTAKNMVSSQCNAALDAAALR